MKKPCFALLLCLVLFLTGGCRRFTLPNDCFSPAVSAAAPEMPSVPVPTVHTNPSPSPAITTSPEPVSDKPFTTEPSPEPEDADFVRVLDYIPDVLVELKYATEENFTGQVVYNFSEAYLRYGTVKKLRAAQTALAELGFGLKIWDAFRPVAAQFSLWEVCPDPKYVANPNTGASSHSRGNTVDITLVTQEGAEVPMPTGFDDFSAMADRDYTDVSGDAGENARLLEHTMQEAGFNAYAGEWWHFSDSDVYPVEQDFLPDAL